MDNLTESFKIKYALTERKAIEPENEILIICLLLIIFPYLWSLIQESEYQGIYVTIITIANLFCVTALFTQFPRINQLERIVQLRSVGCSKNFHQKVIKGVILFFILHPILIILPQIFASPESAFNSLWGLFTVPESATGVYAWALICGWGLLSFYKEKLNINYKAWRVSHGLGLIAIVMLATDHAVSVGRHGQYDHWFDYMWIALCYISVSLITYSYFVKPGQIIKHPA